MTSQVKDWPAGNVKSFSENGATGTIGHYTQVVWAESYEVGCGYIEYPNGGFFKKVNTIPIHNYSSKQF